MSQGDKGLFQLSVDPVQPPPEHNSNQRASDSPHPSAAAWEGEGRDVGAGPHRAALLTFIFHCGLVYMSTVDGAYV